MEFVSSSATSFFASFISPDTCRRIRKAEQASTTSADGTTTPLAAESIPGLTDALRHSLLQSTHLEQRGVMRSNCIDCLDRTNVAQVGVIA